jgi:hypothetical protein
MPCIACIESLEDSSHSFSRNLRGIPCACRTARTAYGQTGVSAPNACDAEPCAALTAEPRMAWHCRASRAHTRVAPLHVVWQCPHCRALRGMQRRTRVACGIPGPPAINYSE